MKLIHFKDINNYDCYINPEHVQHVIYSEVTDSTVITFSDDCLRTDMPISEVVAKLEGRESVKTKLDQVPYQKIIDLYHDVTRLPRVTVLSEKRKRSIKARWNEGVLDSLEEWEKYFNYVANNPFLNGNNDRNWFADIDFLIKPETAIKCQEGKYNGI